MDAALPPSGEPPRHPLSPGAASRLTSAELIELAGADREFFCQTFFPSTVRQRIPLFHHKIWDLLESSARLVMIQVFRDGAKTSTLRMYTAKRIAFGFSRTILFVGKSQDHAIHSIRWIRKRIEEQGLFAKTFKLTPGTKQQDVHYEISHGLQSHPINLLAYGITGSVRGVNIDDFRPDLIVLDDVIDEEIANSEEQRRKSNELIYGALKNSLAPRTDAPDAKMVALQTPLNRDDFSVLALQDPEWTSARFGVWTPETENLPVQYQESSWPDRYPTADLRKEKQAYIGRNQLSIWMREKECKVTSPETSAFVSSWLQTYDLPPENMVIYAGIDPVPPPSDRQVSANMQNKDFEALTVVGRKGNDYFLLEYAINRGHQPDWTIQQFFRLSLKYRPRQWIVEAVAYQRTLAWILRQAMNYQRQHFVIHEFIDKRKKYDLIVDSLSGIASNRHLHVRKEHSDFISQFNDYPNIKHDDIINSVAMTIAVMQSAYTGAEEDYSWVQDEEKNIPPLAYNQSLMAP